MQATLIIRAGASIGSGVLISSDGWALTAAHVVSGLNEVSIQTYSGIELTAKVVRTDNTQDVALIRLPGRGYPCVGLASEGSVGLGSDLYAIGAPSGDSLAFSITKGVISGFREGQGTRYIQTDTALNPGNSGGPLLSSDGKLVGIVSWKIVAVSIEGLAFGVPIKAFTERLGIAWE
jgi:S1-C subfamily serine protease